MKRTISVILCLLLVLSSVTLALADTVDLSTFDNDALLELLQQVQQEVVNRKLAKSATLPAGSYIVGKDLPSGSYILNCKYDGGWWADIYVIGNGGEGKEKFNGTVFAEDNATASVKGEGSWKIVLEDGDLFKCTSEVTLTVSTGIVFE